MEWISFVIIALILSVGKLIMNHGDKQAEIEDRKREAKNKEERTAKIKTLGASQFLNGTNLGKIFNKLEEYPHRHKNIKLLKNDYDHDRSSTRIFYNEGILIKVCSWDEDTMYDIKAGWRGEIIIYKSPFPPFPELIKSGGMERHQGFTVWKNSEWTERGPWEKRIMRILMELKKNYASAIAKDIEDKATRKREEGERKQEQERAYQALVEQARENWERSEYSTWGWK